MEYFFGSKRENPLERYQKCGHAKRGERFGLVFEGRHTRNSLIVELKEIHFLGPISPSYVNIEISLLQELEHTNIIKLLEVVTGPKSMYMVLERTDWNLKNFIVAHPHAARNPQIVKRYLHQIVTGVAYCHSRNIVHQDIRPRNFLILYLTDTLKLTDFGSATKPNVPALVTAYIPGDLPPKWDESLWYTAPELLMPFPMASPPVDMWSVGCVFAEMVISRPLFYQQPGFPPFVQPQVVDPLRRIFSIMGTPTDEHWPEVSHWLSNTYGDMEPRLADVVPGLDPSGLDLLSRMLSMNPTKRITAAEALDHPYLKPPATL